MNLNNIKNTWNGINVRTKRLFFSLCLLLTLPSCVSHLIANQMVAGPNHSIIGYELSNQFSNFDEGHNGLLKISGVSLKSIELPTRKISLSYIDIAAGDYGFSYATKAIPFENGKIRRINTDWQWRNPNCNISNLKENNAGILVLLHGWGRNKNSLLSYGIAFAQQGYRVIIPDLRGHGDSSGDWVSFGAEEGHDISALMNQLAIDKYDLMGFSLGASAGLHIASLDKRVNNLVIVSPMHSLQQTIPKFVKQSPKWLGKLVESRKESALARANDISGYSYEQTSDSVSAARLITKPVLFIYGSIDKMSDQRLNTLLSKQGSQKNRLYQLDGLRHTHVLLHQSALMEPINQWLGLKVKSSNDEVHNICSFINFST